MDAVVDALSSDIGKPFGIILPLTVFYYLSTLPCCSFLSFPGDFVYSKQSPSIEVRALSSPIPSYAGLDLYT
jgi:hypothetical protein